MPDALAERPSALQLFLIFARIGLTSFGGGLSGWMLREFVQRRRLMSEEDFLNGLSVAQALPGVNVTNMAIWIGYRLGGRNGAIASWLGIVVPAAFVIVLIGSVFDDGIGLVVVDGHLDPGLGPMQKRRLRCGSRSLGRRLEIAGFVRGASVGHS